MSLRRRRLGRRNSSPILRDIRSLTCPGLRNEPTHQRGLRSETFLLVSTGLATRPRCSLFCPSGENLTLDTRFRGRLSTLLGHSASIRNGSSCPIPAIRYIRRDRTNISGFTEQFARAFQDFGNYGVELFFVISGYLIYSILLRRCPSFIPFMTRRAQTAILLL